MPEGALALPWCPPARAIAFARLMLKNPSRYVDQSAWSWVAIRLFVAVMTSRF